MSTPLDLGDLRMLEQFAPQLPAEIRKAARAHAAATAVRRRRRRRTRVGGGLLVVAACTSFAFTPPGREASGWIAEQVGLAEPGDPPTLDVRHLNGSMGFTSTGEQPVTPDYSQRGKAVVIDSTMSPDGVPLEVVAFQTSNATCVGFELPTLPRAEPSCFEQSSDPEGLGPVSGTYPSPHEPVPETTIISGTAGTDVDRVLVSYDDAAGISGEVEADMADLRLARDRLGPDLVPLQAFVAFLPADVEEPSSVIEIRAFSGPEVVGKSVFNGPGGIAAQDELMQETREQQQKLDDTFENALKVVESGDYAASLNQAHAANVLRDLIGPGKDQLTPLQAKQLERQATHVLNALRAAGDIPG